MGSARPRVLLADDHPRAARALRPLLEPEFDVAAVLGDGHALLREAEAIRPDVISTDICMPELDDQELIERGYAAGALPYVMTDTVSRELAPAVRTALRGE